MKDAIPTPINQLQPYKKAVKIQVLCTMWRARIPETADKYMGLRCILIDEKQRRSLTSRSNARVTLSRMDRSPRHQYLCDHCWENIVVILSSDSASMCLNCRSVQAIHIWINAMDSSQPMDLKFQCVFHHLSYLTMPIRCYEALRLGLSEGERCWVSETRGFSLGNQNIQFRPAHCTMSFHVSSVECI
ncbi:uncharacterized protein [Malus domestica]|uniref:uncharacterized protein isoform X1 n=1 Tax=Malus domestica TaxID=3750 RepID=UPI0039756C9C